MRFEVVDGVGVAVATGGADQALSPRPIDLSVAPGAELVLSRSWRRSNGSRLDLFCARASSALWMPGLERPLLSAAAAVTRRSLAAEDMALGGAREHGHHWRQSFEASSSGSPVAGEVALGFAGAERDLLLCSAACSAPACETGLALDGALAAPPADRPLSQALAWVAREPGLALGLAAAVLLAIIALILWRRPRPTY